MIELSERTENPDEQYQPSEREENDGEEEVVGVTAQHQRAMAEEVVVAGPELVAVVVRELHWMVVVADCWMVIVDCRLLAVFYSWLFFTVGC